MKYYFNIGDLIFLIESDFLINWNPFILEFSIKETKEFDFFYKCVWSDKIPEISGKLIYTKENIEVFQDNEIEYRLFYIPLYHIPYILLKDDNKENTLYIKKEYADLVNRPKSFSILNALAIEKKLISNNAFILHASYIIYNNNAILFSAPSGTGKSTQAELWKKYENATIINGDRTLIRKDNNKWYAYGFPVCGSSKICLNIKAPIKSIIYLQQSSNNTIEQLNLDKAIKNILSETSINFWNRDFLNKSIDIISSFCIDIPIYLYSCTKEKDAVEYLKSILEEQI